MLAEHVQVNRVALARGGKSGAGFPRAAARSVNAFAVARQPNADRAQDIHLPRLDPPVRHGADVQQQIPVTARAPRQNADNARRRFDFIIGLPRPLRADRHAGLPWRPVVVGADPLFRCEEITVLRQFVLVQPFVEISHFQPVVDDDPRCSERTRL